MKLLKFVDMPKFAKISISALAAFSVQKDQVNIKSNRPGAKENNTLMCCTWQKYPGTHRKAPPCPFPI